MRGLQRMPIRGLVMSAMLSLASSAGAFEVYTVGGDAACEYSSIQDAIDAAAANPGEDYVWIASNQSYDGQHIVVTDQAVDIEGGFSDCSDFDPETSLTTVSGAGNGGGAVFAFRGTTYVLMYNLFIRDADRGGNGDGGGIDFAGAGTLHLVRTTVSLNSADYGGGINFRGTGGDAVLRLASDTLILNNLAHVSGGGIRIEGSARLFVLEPQTLIAFNAAFGGYGGGIEVLGPARADIGSAGYNGGAVLQFNQAAYGGGIAAAAPDSDSDVVVRLFSTNANEPVQVSGNTATATGGGIWLQPYETLTGGAYATLCAQDFRINDNIAQEGAAIYADLDSNVATQARGSIVYLNQFCTGPEPPADLGAVPCAQGVACNEFVGNSAENASGDPSGAIILLQTFADLIADRFRMHENRGRHLIRSVADSTFIKTLDMNRTILSNCLLTDNETAASLILQTPGEDDSALEMDACTIARNAIASGAVLELDLTHATLARSIFDQPGTPTLSADGLDAIGVSQLLTNDTSTLPLGVDIVEGAPLFVDAEQGDYRLRLDSPGVDFAFEGTQAIGLDGMPRHIDQPGVPNLYGVQDLGPFETQLACGPDAVFCNGFDPT